MQLAGMLQRVSRSLCVTNDLPKAKRVVSQQLISFVFEARLQSAHFRKCTHDAMILVCSLCYCLFY
jgi:hypothetical protein